MTDKKTEPITDAALAELDRLYGKRNESEGHYKLSRVALHNAYPALRQRLAEAESRLAEVERERDEAIEQRSLARMADYADELLASRDARMKREGAAEALEDIAKDSGIDSGKAYMATVVYREFPDVLTMKVGVVDAADLMQAAQRLREGGE